MSRWEQTLIPRAALRDGGSWDTPAETRGAPEANRARELTRLKANCPSCRFENEVMAAPWSPVWAKAKCSHCERVFEVRTRDSAMDAISEECDYQEDVRNQRAHPKAFSKWARSRPETHSKKVNTGLGPAFIIGG